MPEDSKHASEEMLRRFFRSELARRDTVELVQHLMTRCPQCLETAIAVGRQEGFILAGEGFAPENPLDPDLYRASFPHLSRSGDEAQMRLAAEKLRGIGLFAELEEARRDDRLEMIRDDLRFHSWGLLCRLMGKSREYSLNDPPGGLHLAMLALAVVETLDPGEYKPALLADYRISALALLGNARRLAADFEGARQELRRAWETLQDGTGDPMAEANLVSLEASLLRDLGQFEEAVVRLDRAIVIYQEVKDWNRVARTLVKQGWAAGCIDPRAGISMTQDALGLLDAGEHPRLELCARHNLIWFLNDNGQAREALALLELSRSLYQDFADAWTRLRLHWVEGRIARSLGHLAEAESTFRLVWYEFEARGMHYELTLLSIDLAEVYSARGKFSPAVQLVEEFFPLLQSWGMHREGLAMWILFRDAMTEHARQQVALDAAIFHQVASYFLRAWRQPMNDAAQFPIS
jgi:tetratricopeptide (TPR) repeat protein